MFVPASPCPPCECKAHVSYTVVARAPLALGPPWFTQLRNRKSKKLFTRNCINWYKDAIDQHKSDYFDLKTLTAQRSKSAHEIIVEAHRDLVRLRTMPGAAAAAATADIANQHHHIALAGAPGAAANESAEAAAAAYRDAAGLWCEPGHYNHFGIAEAATEAAAQAAGAAAAAQRAAQAEAAGKRATQRFVDFQAAAPPPDTNAKIAAEWLTAATILKTAARAAKARHLAACARQRHQNQLSSGAAKADSSHESSHSSVEEKLPEAEAVDDPAAESAMMEDLFGGGDAEPPLAAAEPTEENPERASPKAMPRSQRANRLKRKRSRH